MIEHTGCAGVMIGRARCARRGCSATRGAFSRPASIPPPPSIEQIVQLMRDHFYNMCRFRNEHVGRHRIPQADELVRAKSLPCTRLREEMRLVKDANDFEGILSRFLEWRRERDAQRPHTSTIDEPVPAMAGE